MGLIEIAEVKRLTQRIADRRPDLAQRVEEPLPPKQALGRKPEKMKAPAVQ
ncbi:MAG: hypothetical protein JWO83_2477 [Caulobacteraceae bacterium]|nr:hypothetical protein [Caulobacteraceae bacterium]